jgi:hypothetical protein
MHDKIQEEMPLASGSLCDDKLHSSFCASGRVPAVQRNAIRRREVSSRELVDYDLSGIARINAELNAIVTLDAEGARVGIILGRPPSCGYPLSQIQLRVNFGDSVRIDGS